MKNLSNKSFEYKFKSIFFAYLLFMICVTLIRKPSAEMQMELVPFWSYFRPELRIEIIMNYVLFIPFGLFLCFYKNGKWNLKCLTITGLCMSSMIEVLQLIFRVGLFEFDDIIGNTIGCFIGAFIGNKIRLKYIIKRNG